MSRISQLTNQVNQLQSELAVLQRESRERDRRYQQEHQMRMQELKHTMQNALERHNASQVQDIQRQMDALNAELMNRIQRNHDALKTELERNLEARHRDLLRQIQEYYDEVQARIDHEVSDAIRESDAQKEALAKQEYRAAAERFDVVRRRAHEELFPGRLAIYQGTLDHANRMLREQKQFEASTATSVMLKVNLQDFEASIDDKLAEWMRSYLRMEEAFVSQNARIEHEILTIDGERLSADTAMVWTEHRYDEAFGRIRAVQKVMEDVELYRRIERDDVISIRVVESYLRQTDGEAEKPDSRGLDEYTRFLKYELPGILDEMKKELASAYRCSAQRAVWAGRMKTYFAKKHNTGLPSYDGFVEADVSKKEANLYRLDFARPNGNGRMCRYVIHIVPVMVNGEVENHIRIFMDFRVGGAAYQKKQELKLIREILHAVEEKAVHIGVGTDEDVLQGSADEEYSLQPDASGRGEQLILHKQQMASERAAGARGDAGTAEEQRLGRGRRTGERRRRTESEAS